MKLGYFIDNEEYSFSCPKNQNYYIGDNRILSNLDNDIVYGQEWYESGFKVQNFLSNDEYLRLRERVSDTIQKIIEKELNLKILDFEIDRYHEIVLNDNDHLKIVSKTRDLFHSDFSDSIFYLIKKFEQILGFQLTDTRKNDGHKIHIIIRINRPNSNDFNPPHKDAYEALDSGNPFNFVNFWIPISGVTSKSSLPIVPKSHLIPENEIERTLVGGVLGPNTYRVRLIKSWNKENTLIRSNIQYKDVLIFSPFLIHGLALNKEINLTRVALEFRLFKLEK
jgi:hypothetical protein